MKIKSREEHGVSCRYVLKGYMYNSEVLMREYIRNRIDELTLPCIVSNDSPDPIQFNIDIRKRVWIDCDPIQKKKNPST